MEKKSESELIIDEKFRLSIIDHYPRPIAVAYDRLVNKTNHPMEKFFAMIDTVEALVHCIASIVLWSYLKKDKKDRNSNQDQQIFHAIFNPKGISFGTWKDIAKDIEYLPKDEIPNGLWNFLQNKSYTNILTNFVELRNFQIGHSYVRTVPVFQIEIEELLSDLNNLLSGCNFLQDMEFFVPVQYDNVQLIKVDKYIGTQRYENVSLNQPLQIGETLRKFLKEKQSFLAYFKSTQTWIPLFPFYVWKSWPGGQSSGMYFLSSIKLSKKSRGKPEIVDIRYRTYEEELAKAKNTDEYKVKDSGLEIEMVSYLLDLLGISYGIHIRSRKLEVPGKEKDLCKCLDLSEFFNGQTIEKAEDWQKIPQKIHNFFGGKDVKGLPAPIPLYFDCHLSIAFYAGYLLRPKQSDLKIVPMQKDNASRQSEVFEEWGFPEDWNDLNTNDSNSLEYLWKINEEPEKIEGEIVIAIGAARNDIKQDLNIFMEKSSMQKPFYFTLANPNNQMEKQLAWKYARGLQQILYKKIRPDQCKKIHLLLASPVAFAYILGQELHVTPEVQLYEYDFEGRTGYSPSICISHNVKEE